MRHFLPAKVRAKVMEVLDPQAKGKVQRHDLVAMLHDMYERRRDLAKSLDNTDSVLRTLERISLARAHGIYHPHVIWW